MVEQMSYGTGGGGNAQVEDREDVPVEIHPERGRAGELPQDVLLLQAGDPAGFEDFLVHGRLNGVIASQDGLRKQDGDVAVEGRVLHFRDQVVPFAEKGPAGEIVRIGHGQFHFAVQARFPGLNLLRIVPGAVPSQVVQDGTDIAAVPEGRPVDAAVGNQLEVHGLVFPGNDGKGTGDIAPDFRRDGADFGLGNFQIVKAGRICRCSGQGSRKIDGRVGERFAGDRIRHFALHPGHLGGNPSGDEQQPTGQGDMTDSRHNPSNVRFFIQKSKNLTVQKVQQG